VSQLRLGAWARSSGFIGLVAGHGDGEVALFDPAARQVTRVPAEAVEPIPAGAVSVTLRLEVPLAHGLAEDDLRRWVASLVDGVLRERAAAALHEAGLDQGPALPEVTVEVRPADGRDALCLAGHRTPPGACVVCGREAVRPL
jgi:hypothetical protein